MGHPGHADEDEARPPPGALLCGRAMEILDAARTLGDGPLVFPSRSGRWLDVKQLRRLLERCGIAAVPHGFRSSFRDWAAEETDHPISTMVLHRRNSKAYSALMGGRHVGVRGPHYRGRDLP